MEGCSYSKLAKTVRHYIVLIRTGRRLRIGDENVSLVDVMIAGQKSRVAFSALVEVRNKLLSAYQEIMNMQV